MNKQISVQYAYKKDGKGERHGDEAERMLAAEAKKNMTQPALPTLPAQLFAGQQAAAPNNMTPNAATSGMFINGQPGMAFGRAPPPPPQGRPTPQPPSLSAPPPAGLPPRPPPSQAGYGGPQNFLPPGFNMPHGGNFPAPGPPPGLPPGFQPPR
jgi:splicing factor 3B subunit 4